MPDRTIRTIGASVVLALLVVIGAMQLAAKEEPAPAEIVADDATTTSAADTAATDSRPTTTAPEPFTFRIGVLSGVSTDNFWAYYGAEPSVWNSYILGPTKPALYTIDGGEIGPELATAVATPTWDGDGWRVRVDLDPGFAWSDGEPVTADDYVFTFETVRALGLGGSWAEAFPATVKSVHADGEHQLRIEFTERPNLRVWPYGAGLAPVMARHVWVERVPGATAADLYAVTGVAVSGGPLQVAEISDDLVVAHANPGYPEAAYPDTVEYHVYPDETALVAAMAADEVDSILTPKGITEEQAATVAGSDGVEVLTSPTNGIRYLGFNTDRAPMSAPAFRTALALLLDREALSAEITRGEAAWSMIPAANDHWYDAEKAAANRDRYSGTPAERLGRALEGLAAAGYVWETPPSVGDDGQIVAGTGLTIAGQTPQPLTILTPGDAYDPDRPAYVARIADTLGLLGFDVRPVTTDFDTVVDLAFTRGEEGQWEYDMYLLGWTLGNPGLPAFYGPFFAPDGEMNNTGYESAAFAGALGAYEKAYTVAEARAALWEMERILSVDLPYLVLYNNRLTEAYRSDRVGFGPGETLGGLQGRLGGIGDVSPTG